MEVEQRPPVARRDFPRGPIHIDVAEIEMDTPEIVALREVLEKCSQILDIFERRRVTAVAVEATDLVVAVFQGKRVEFVAVAAYSSLSSSSVLIAPRG